ncbi:hypothetical protein [Desulfosporosinus sp. Sb-LF]|uniref:hypothetical protein n=1 Tax=Desulfosporosinus sp. Sb-LF TaxID=2560027 RepID=UPI00107FC2D1|nr:hypothetical protein [Desulfosporosinus sp. Sb-LF]TGE33541.1 hypothetical protein E4K68_05175 [Desulfosporosinus sp. Sb-LF]
MNEQSERTRTVEFELGPEDLVIVSQLEPDTFLIKVKVYEQKDFILNPNPLENDNQMAEYSICPGCLTEAVADIRDMYTGWSKINKSSPIQIIGIHNQDHNILFIQFCLGQRYFIYERCPKLHKETVYEELFGQKHNLRLRGLGREDEQYLITNLRFMPKAKRAISFYPYKTQYILTRKHHSLPHSC